MIAAKPKSQPITASMVADSPYVYDQLVAKDHILRQVKEQVDFTFLHDEVAGLYCADNGAPAIAPEVIGKLSFLQFYYNLSDRQVEEACRQRLDFKFFLNLPVEADAPCDATTLCPDASGRKRWGSEVCEKYFEQTVAQAQADGLLGAKRSVDSSKTLMNAAVLKASQLLSRLCEKLLETLRDVVSADRLSELTSEDKALREDTSWWLSSELKEAHYLRWGKYARELLEFTQSFVHAPGAASSVANWEKQRERLERLSALLTKHLDDTASESALKTHGGRKDKLVSEVDSDARNVPIHRDG